MGTTIVIGKRRMQVTNHMDAHKLIMDGLGWVIGTGIEPMAKPSTLKRQRNRRKPRR